MESPNLAAQCRASGQHRDITFHATRCACLQVASQLVHKAELACNRLALQLRAAPAPPGGCLQVSQGLHSITQQALLRSHGSILAASVSIQSATTSSRSGSYTSMTSVSASLSASTASMSRSGSVSKPDGSGGPSARAPEGADQAGTRSPAASRRPRSAREVCSAHVMVTHTERVSGSHRQRQRLREGSLISRQEMASQNKSHSNSNPVLQQLAGGVQHVEAYRDRSPSADGHVQHPEVYTSNTEQILKSAAADLEGTAGVDEAGQGTWQRAKRAHSRSPGSPRGHRSTKHRSRTGPHDQTSPPAGACWCGQAALGPPCLFPCMLLQPLGGGSMIASTPAALQVLMRETAVEINIQSADSLTSVLEILVVMHHQKKDCYCCLSTVDWRCCMSNEASSSYKIVSCCFGRTSLYFFSRDHR